MLEVNFKVVFDIKKGKIVKISRSCRIPCPCEKCNFKNVCDTITNKLQEYPLSMKEKEGKS